MRRSEKGIVLVMVITIAVILSIIGFAVLTLARQEAIQTRIDVDKTRAFYLAEAGLPMAISVLNTQFGNGTLNDNDLPMSIGETLSGVEIYTGQ